MCQPADLQALFRGFHAAGGPLVGPVVLVSTGSTPCWLSGGPQGVVLRDAGGEAVPANVRAADQPAAGNPVALVPGTTMPGFGAPPPHGSAWFLVTWTNWCADTSPDVRSVQVALRGGGSVTAALDDSAPEWAVGPPTPRCDDAKAGSTLTIGRYLAPA